MTSQESTNLWRQYHHAVRIGDLAASLQMARLGVQLQREAGDLRHAGIWQRAVSAILCQQGRYDEAAREASESVDTQADRYEKALSLIALGQMHSQAGRYESALATYRVVPKTANRAFNDPYLRAHFYGSRAVTFCRMGRHDKAVMNSWQRAASLFLEVGHLRRAAAFINNMGFVLTRLGRYEDAEQRLLEALELIEQDPHSLTEAVIHDSLGSLYTLKGQHFDAERFLKKSAKIFERLGNKPQLVGTLLHFSEFHQRIRHYETALEEAVRALELARQTGHRSLCSEAIERVKSVARGRTCENLTDLFEVHRRNCSRSKRIKRNEDRGPDQSG